MKFRALVILFAAHGLLGCGDDDTHLTRDQLVDPETCKTCHADHFTDWAGSMHAYASEDPLFIAMNKRGQRETNSMLGDFCVKCHAPMAVHEGATTDGLNLANLPAKLKGVTCFFCHTVDAVRGDHNAPLELSDDGITMRGEYRDSVKNTAHHTVYSDLHDRDEAASATLCGSCHDIVTPAGAAIERTFQEWRASVFSMTKGASCPQCHMHELPGLRPIAMAPGVFARKYHEHAFPAVDQALLPGFPNVDAQKKAIHDFLATTVFSSLCVAVKGDGTAAIRVVLDAAGAGHDFPSGAAQDRRLWTEVIAYSDTQVIYQSGVVTDGMAPTANPDPDFWMIRDCMLDAQDRPVSMFWQASNYETNLLPAQLTFDALDPRFYQSHIIQNFPHDPTAHFGKIPDRVTLRLRFQPVGLDVLDDLIQSGDLDPSVRSSMPTYDISFSPTLDMPLLEWTATNMSMANLRWLEDGDATPVYCVSPSGLNVQTRTPTTNHLKCSP